MKQKDLILTIVTVLISLSWSNPPLTQDYSFILDKLDKIEARLNELETNQNRKFGQMQERIKQIEPMLAGLHDGDDISTLREPAAMRTIELEQVKEEPKGDSQEEIVSGLTEDMRSLTAYLRLFLAPVELESPPANETGSETGVSGLDISGFADLGYAALQNAEAQDAHGFGQVEVDLETTLAEKVVIAAAIVYDSELQNFGLGALKVDFHLFGISDSHFHPVNGIDHSGIIAGQFDVPFGIAWHEYASPDRRLISEPLVVEETHEAWNDYGLQAYLECHGWNAVLFSTNGFGYDDEGMKMSLGGRFGVKPHEILEIGASYAGFLNQNDRLGMDLIGADLQFSYQALTLKGEYIAHRMGLSGNDPVTQSGVYGLAVYNLQRFFLACGYGTFYPNSKDEEDLWRLSLGGGWRILDGCELRTEHQLNSGADEDATYLQLVVGF